MMQTPFQEAIRIANDTVANSNAKNQVMCGETPHSFLILLVLQKSNSSQFGKPVPDLGLSENGVPLNQLVYHRFPY
jgi:hypothetical protein